MINDAEESKGTFDDAHRLIFDTKGEGSSKDISNENSTPIPSKRQLGEETHSFKQKPNDTPFLTHYKKPSLKRIGEGVLNQDLEIASVKNIPNAD